MVGVLPSKEGRRDTGAAAAAARRFNQSSRGRPLVGSINSPFGGVPSLGSVCQSLLPVEWSLGM